MRPNRLELEGFTSFQRRVEIDFTGMDLFAVTGATGAGKTSLVDAILFALYGRTPRLGVQGVTELISLGSSGLKVVLEFEAAGGRYRVTRSLRQTRRGPGSSMVLEREGSGGWEEAAAGKEVTPRIEALLGLDFDGFTRSVVLPQGEFDEFLRGDAKKRRGILSDLLRLGIYETMRKRAGQGRNEARGQAEFLEKELATRFVEVTAERRVRMAEEAGELERVRGELERERVRLEGLRSAAIELRGLRRQAAQAREKLEEWRAERERAKAEGGEAGKELEAQRERLVAIEAAIRGAGYDERIYVRLAAGVPVARLRARAAEELVESEAARDEVAGERAAVERAVRAAEEVGKKRTAEREAVGLRSQQKREAWEGLRRQYGTAERVEDALRDLRGLETLRSKREAAEKELEGWRSKEGELRRQAAEADRAAREAEREYDRLQTLHAGEGLRAKLELGEPCPVCEQVVTSLPAASVHGALEGARANRDQARKVQGKAQAALDRLPVQVESLESALRLMRDQVGAVESKVTGITGKAVGVETEWELEEAAERLRQAEQEAEAAGKAAQQAQLAENEAMKGVQGARHQEAMWRQRAEGAETQVGQAAARVAELDGRLAAWEELQGVEIGELERRLGQMEEARRKRDTLERGRQQVQERLEAARKQSEESQLRWRSLEQQIAHGEAEAAAVEAQEKEKEGALRREMEVEGDAAAWVEARLGEGQRQRAQVEQQAARVEAAREQLERDLAQAEEMRGRIGELREQQVLLGQLAEILSSDNLVAYIQREALLRLVVDANRQMDTLSGGRYAFTLSEDGNDFQVIDHWNGDEIRGVKTLSGGESFLASLSLALALAESLSQYCEDRERLALDSLFLDEGFSTLDGETLGTVVGAIETLANQSRMIGVISHVGELGEQFPTRIHVEKVQGGSRVTVVRRQSALRTVTSL